jgi:serine/threonine protein kinase
MAALDHAPEGREAFLITACGNDAVLFTEVSALLAAHEAMPTGFLTEPAVNSFTDSDLGATIKAAPGTLPPNHTVEREGERIGRYKLLQEIGEGGFGTVWMAEQMEPVSRRVALKIIKLGMDTREVIARFEQERQALAMMDHPNIAKVFDAGTTEKGRPFFVMELVKGMPITQYCNEAALGTRERLALFGDVCAAINHAHQKGIIHRDIKPSNVIVTLHGDKPVVKVIDFGIAKATQGKLTDKTLFTRFDQFVGTPVYMSPEQASLSGLDIDTRSDIYALGILLYELLVGKPPFDGKSLLSAGYEEMRRIIREVEPPKPSSRLSTVTAEERSTLAKARQIAPEKLSRLVEPDLDWIVMKAIEKDRTRRYETASAFAQDIVRFLADEPVSATPPSAGYQLRKFVRRNKAALRVAALIAAVLVAATAVSTWQAIRATAERDAKDVALRNAKAISTFLTEVFQSPDPTRDGRTITVAETLDKAAKRLESDLSTQPERRAQLQYTLAETYHALGLDAQAIPLMEKVRNHELATVGPEHLNTITTNQSLAVCYHAVGRREEALKLQEEVLALQRKLLGPEHADTLAAMGNLAGFYSDAGRKDEALKIQEEVLAFSKKNLGPEHPDTLAAINNLAGFYFRAGRRDEALKMWEEVLALRRKMLGPEHPETLGGMNNLALSYFEAGRKDEALKMREEVLTLSRKVRGPEHPDTLLAMSNLASSYAVAGRHEDALKMQEGVLQLSRDKLGPEHPNTLMAMSNLATGYFKAGRKEEALKLQEEVLTLFRKVRGPEHLDTLLTMKNLASSYSGARRHEEAIKLGEEMLPLRRKVSGPEHPDTFAVMADLSLSYHEVGRKQEALKMREELLSWSRRVNGPEHLTTLEVMSNLATSYFDCGRKDEALKMREEALPLFLKVSGPEHPDTLAAMNNLAFSYLDSGRKDEALKMREEVLPLYVKVCGSEHPGTLMAVGNLAASYAATGRHEEAIKLGEAVLPLRRKVLGPQDPDAFSVMENLAGSYAATDRPEEAIKLGEEVLALRRKVLGPDHPDALSVMGNLAGSYFHAGRKEESLKLREETLALCRKVLAPQHPDTLMAMRYLASALFQAGRLEDSAKTFSEITEFLRLAGQGPESEMQVTFHGAIAQVADELTKGPIPPDAIARYYAEHQEAFRQTSVRIHMITIPREEAKEARDAQRQKVEALRAKIEGGTPFADVAKEHSKDAYAEDGGERGTVERGTLRADLDKVVFTAKPGTPVIHEDETFLWILQVDDRKEGEIAPLEKAQERITQILREQKRDELIQKWQQEARKKVELESPAKKP